MQCNKLTRLNSSCDPCDARLQIVDSVKPSLAENTMCCLSLYGCIVDGLAKISVRREWYVSTPLTRVRVGLVSVQADSVCVEHGWSEVTMNRSLWLVDSSRTIEA